MASAVQSHQLSPSPAATDSKRAKGGGRLGQERGRETLWWWGAVQGHSNLVQGHSNLGAVQGHSNLVGLLELAAGISGIIVGMVQGEQTASEYRGCCN